MSNRYFSLTRLRRKPPRVVRLSMPSDALAGLRLAFVSDVHMREAFPAKRVEALIDQIGALGPDIVLWGGDFAETRALQREFFRIAGRLTPRLGSFSVMGNNDIEQTPLPELRKMQADAGIELLVNQARGIPHGDGLLSVIGLDEPKYGAPDFSLLEAPREPSEFRILLAHSPLVLGALPRGKGAAPELILCGHTHGGQISIFGLNPYTIGYERTHGLKNFYVTGAHRIGESLLVVSNGIGDSSIPLRVGAPPELHFVTFSPQNCLSKS